MQVLRWRLSPQTAAEWVMQFFTDSTLRNYGSKPSSPSKRRTSQQNLDACATQQRFTLPPQDMHAYQRAMALVNVATLSANAIAFPPSIIAAAALHITADACFPVTEFVTRSGYQPMLVHMCISWLHAIFVNIERANAMPTAV